MADSVKIVMDQVDEETGKPISHVVCEWYGMDRNDANAMSMDIADGVVDRITKTGQHNPFAPVPLQDVQHYYGLFRPRASLRYSHACGSATCVSPLTSRRQVPTFRTKA